MIKQHTIRRFPTLSSEAFQGWMENGFFNWTDLGGNSHKDSGSHTMYFSNKPKTSSPLQISSLNKAERREKNELHVEFTTSNRITV